MTTFAAVLWNVDGRIRSNRDSKTIGEFECTFE